jgi:MoaA/NifB/PqqE/SkfB family radical SAM enzyme
MANFPITKMTVSRLNSLLLQRFSFFSGVTFSKPTNIYLAPTTACNCRCQMCDLWNWTVAELPFSVIKECLTKISRWSPNSRIQISGGEPFMRKDIIDILRHCVSLGLYAGITTNGTLINSETAAELMSLGIFNINISIDSLDPEKHDLLRGVKGTYQRAERAMNTLIKERDKQKSNTKIILKVVLSKVNLEEAVNMVHFATDRSLDGVLFQPLQWNVGTNADYELLKKNSLWVNDMDKLDHVIDDIIAMKRHVKLILNPTSDLLRTKQYFRNPAAKNKNSCLSAYSNLMVYASGRITLCAEFDSVGNICRENDIQKIWKSDEAGKIRKKMRKCRMFCTNTCNAHYTLREYYQIFRHFFSRPRQNHQ